MSSSEDVKTLFRRFGGQPETYQEVVRERQAVHSLGKWAMLGQVELGNPQAIPSVRRAVKTGATRPPAEPLPAAVAQPVAARVAAAPMAAVVAPAVALPAPVEAMLAPAVAAPAAVVAPAPFAAPQPVPPVVVAPALPRALPVAATRVVATPEPAWRRPEALAAQAPSSPLAPPAPLFRPTAPAPSSARVSPLAARLKGQTETPAPASAAVSHSLPGLFGRLLGRQPETPKPGLLRRKFTK